MKPAQHEGPPALRLARERQRGVRREQRAQRLAELHAGQGRAQAEVHTHTEGDVVVGVPVDPELVGRVEHLRVAVGRAQEDRDPLARFDDDVGELLQVGLLVGRGADHEPGKAFRSERADCLEGLDVTEVVAAGQALPRALEMADGLAAFPQATMLADRRAAIEGLGLPLADGLGWRVCLPAGVEVFEDALLGRQEQSPAEQCEFASLSK